MVIVKLTLLLSVILMAGFFLLLFTGVGLIQDKRYFSSAPKLVYEAIKSKKMRFRGQHILGWTLAIFALICMIGSVVIGAIDGIKNNFSFLEFFIRFATMLLLLKLFDLVFFDLFLLCHSNFFTHFYPEVKNLLGPHLFGFNKKDHIVQTIIIIITSLALAGLCSLILCILKK